MPVFAEGRLRDGPAEEPAVPPVELDIVGVEDVFQSKGCEVLVPYGLEERFSNGVDGFHRVNVAYVHLLGGDADDATYAKGQRTHPHTGRNLP